MGITTKLHLLTSASGRVLFSLFTFSDRDAKEIIRIKIPDFTQFLCSEGEIWVVPLKCGKELFRLIFNDIIIPTIRTEQKKVHESSERWSLKKSDRALLLIDGESQQLQVILEERERLNVEKIDVLKLAAGCSGLQQPNDVAPVFRGFKARVKCGRDRKPEETREIREVAEEVMKETKGLNGSMRRKVHKIIKLQPILSPAFTHNNIAPGYRDSGVFPPNIHKILRKVNLTPTEYEYVKDVVVPALFRRNGGLFKLTEKHFDDWKVPKTREQEKEEKEENKRDDRVIRYKRHSAACSGSRSKSKSKESRE